MIVKWAQEDVETLDNLLNNNNNNNNILSIKFHFLPTDALNVKNTRLLKYVQN